MSLYLRFYVVDVMSLVTMNQALNAVSISVQYIASPGFSN